MSGAARPNWRSIAAVLCIGLLILLIRQPRRRGTPTEHAHRPRKPVVYVESAASWCDEGTRALTIVAECEAAVEAVGVASVGAAGRAVHRIVSELLPIGCYYKRELPTFYHNYLNKTASELEVASGGRVFLNVGLGPRKSHPPPPPPGNRSLRVALCRQASSCEPDSQGRTCDGWVRELRLHRLSCPLLEAYGLDCTGCRCAAELPTACNDPRLHCRHEKALRKPQSHYSAAANKGADVARSARLVVVGDTHGRHSEIVVPPGDVLIHTGDVVAGTSRDPADLRRELSSFNEWLGGLKHKQKFFVAGNHDLDGGINTSELSGLVFNAVQLLDSREEIDLDDDGLGELSLWGAPWQPQFSGFATYVRPEQIAARWAEIPDGVDVVVTHTPPRGQLDLNEQHEHVGCNALAARLSRVKPSLSVFGHIHPGRPTIGPAARGQPLTAAERGGDTVYVNVASMPGSDDPSAPRDPVVIDVPFR